MALAVHEPVEQQARSTNTNQIVIPYSAILEHAPSRIEQLKTHTGERARKPHAEAPFAIVDHTSHRMGRGLGYTQQGLA